MRERIALWLIEKFLKGADEMMAMLYASKICMEAVNPRTGLVWAFSDVPARLKPQVAAVLIEDCGLPELVPAAFGGNGV